MHNISVVHLSILGGLMWIEVPKYFVNCLQLMALKAFPEISNFSFASILSSPSFGLGDIATNLIL